MESAVSLGPSGSHLTSRDMWYSRQMWKAWRASSRTSDFLLSLRRMDSMFWLSEYQRTSKGFQSETGSFKLSPGQTLNTFCQGPILIKCQNRNQTVGTTGWTGSIGKSYLDRKRLTSPINFAVEGMYIIHPKLDLWNGISDKRTSLSQERAEFTTEKRFLAIMWTTDHMQLESEIIWPATLVTVLTWMLQGGGGDDNVPRSVVNLTIPSSAALTEP